MANFQVFSQRALRAVENLMSTLTEKSKEIYVLQGHDNERPVRTQDPMMDEIIEDQETGDSDKLDNLYGDILKESVEDLITAKGYSLQRNVHGDVSYTPAHKDCNGGGGVCHYPECNC